MFVFLIWLVRMVFATLKGALNVGKVCQGLAPKIIHIHESSRQKSNPTSTTSRTKLATHRTDQCARHVFRGWELELTGEGADAGGKKQKWLDINVSWNTHVVSFCQIAKMKTTGTVDARDPAPPGLEQKHSKKNMYTNNKINYISTGARLFPSRVSDQKPPKKIQAS